MSLDRKKRNMPIEFASQLMPYDVISFDIFDTAIFRKVGMPNDVFTIMAMEIGDGNFVYVRKTAENVARERKEAEEGTREVTLLEIYDVLEEDYDIGKDVLEREVELELELSMANPYIFQVYSELLRNEKSIVFISDMYLPQQVIEKILQKNGYTNYEKLYLSNSYGLRKGDGTLQGEVLKDYIGKNVVHIGDSQIGDVEKSRMAGMDAVFHIDARELVPEWETDNLEGSVYRAVINNCMFNGMWDKNIYYSHGFKVGGILAVGYCEYINRIAKSKNIDKILFCSRDCEVLWKVYNRYFKEFENEYIAISRCAVMRIASEHYLYNWAERFIFKYINPDNQDKTVGQILQEAGVSYLIEYLGDMGIDKGLSAGKVKRGLLKRFIFSHADLIHEYNRKGTLVAEQYYREVIGTSKNILIVDVGWSGTCITALKYFIETKLAGTTHEVSGTLMCSAKNRVVTAYMENGTIDSYICSPFHNIDLLNFMMSEDLSDEELDYRHLSLEYLFTSAEGTLISYKRMEDGSIGFERSGNKPDNSAEIFDMQEGILCFAEKYQEYRNACGGKFQISPYVAFKPLLEAIKDKKYMYSIYCNFPHDSSWVPYAKNTERKTFGDYFGSGE